MDDAARKRLRDLATAATPGPWKSSVWFGTNDDSWTATGPIHDPPDDPYEPSDPHSETARRAQRDSDFVAAASPSAVLELLDEIERLERERDEWRCVAAEGRHALDGKPHTFGFVVCSECDENGVRHYCSTLCEQLAARDAEIAGLRSVAEARNSVVRAAHAWQRTESRPPLIKTGTRVESSRVSRDLWDAVAALRKAGSNE